jgi:hypothetical protein
MPDCLTRNVSSSATDPSAVHVSVSTKYSSATVAHHDLLSHLRLSVVSRCAGNVFVGTLGVCLGVPHVLPTADLFSARGLQRGLLRYI